jgi:hypothetical protein
MQPLALFGPVDALLEPIIEYVLLVLVLANMATRFMAHRANVRAAREEGAEAVSRSTVHEITSVLLVLGSFYLLTVAHHAGMVLSVLVLGLFITDFFEFEARKVEAREDLPLDRPKAALAASVVVLLYAGYLSLFFVIEPLWNSIV